MIWILFSCLSPQKTTPVSNSVFVHPLQDLSVPVVGQAKTYIPPTIAKSTTAQGSTIVLRLSLIHI